MNRQDKWVFGLLSGFAFLYVAIRAYRLSFTHDEAFSFLHIVPEGWLNIISYNTASQIPNNHVLNSLLMKVGLSTLGPAEWVMRLPNVLSLVLFIWAIKELLSHFRSSAVKWFFMVSLLLNPYFLEFFSLARGYGLCFAFLMASIALFLRYFQDSKTKSIVLSMICLTLAIEANFTALYAAFAMFILLGIKAIINIQKARDGRLFTVITLSGITVLALVYEPLRHISEAETLFGPKVSFFVSTVVSLSYLTVVRGVFAAPFELLAFVFAGLFLFSLAMGLVVFKKKEQLQRHTFLIISSLLLLILLPQWIGNWFFDRHLLMSRTGLFMLPIFFLLLSLAFDFAIEMRPQLTKAVILVFAVFFAINGVSKLNLSYATEWYYDKDIKEAYTILKKEAHSKNISNATLGITWFMEPIFNYYIQNDQNSPFQPVTRNGLVGIYDFYCVFPDDKDLLLSKNTTSPEEVIRVIKEFPDGSTLAVAK
ncbi:MAG: hypothetical protein KDC83_05450 [Flavobacteriales bacterium]|nr:hypothetical protein [Flavobacteriales bacterium]